jgi:glycolate oxidase
MTIAATRLDPGILDELRAIIGEDAAVLTSKTSRLNRARVPAPFPVHRWEEFTPDAVVLPRTADQISEIVKLANRLQIPVVPRAGGTGLADGAVPLRRGIVVDVKRMDQIKEIDLVNNTVTVGPGINMQTLNRQLVKHGVMFPDDPASYATALVGGRIGTSGFSLLGSRYGHTRDLVISFEIVLPTGAIVEVGDGGGRKVRKSSTGYHLKHLFMGHQGTLGIVTEATLELVPRAEAEFAAFFLFEEFDTAYRTHAKLSHSGLATLAGVMLCSTRRRLRTSAATTRHTSSSLSGSRRWRRHRSTAPGSKWSPRLGSSWSSGAAWAASTSATRSPRGTGPPATTDTRIRCTAALATARWCR